MSAAAFSWVLFVLSAFGVWLSGINPKAGWRYAIANQAAWLIYAMMTEQWGIAANSVVFSALHARNLWRWRGIAMPRLSSAAKERSPVASAS